MDAVSESLERIGDAPYDIKIYPTCIKLCLEQDRLSSQDVEEETTMSIDDTGGPLAAEVRDMMVSVVSGTSDVWLPLLRYKASTLDLLNNEEDAKALLDLFHAAQNDYLSIPVLKLQVKTLIKLNEESKEQNSSTSLEHWSDQAVRGQLQLIANLASAHMTKSHDVWDPWIKWELEKIDELFDAGSASEAEKQAAISRVDELFLTRIKQPHSTFAATSDMYSPFVSKYFPPDEYEDKLVLAIRMREIPIKQLTWREGNPKRVREQLEQRAVSAGLAQWKQYLSWEFNAKKPQFKLITAVYEKALECAARERWQALCGAVTEENEATKGALALAEQTLYDLWDEFLSYQLKSSSEGDRKQLLTFAKRATRSIPEHGPVWGFYLRIAERAASQETTSDTEMESDDVESVPDIYLRAISTNLLQAKPDDLTALALTRASWSRRRCFVVEEGETVVDRDQMTNVIQIIEGALSYVKSNERGDPRMSLEGFLSTFYRSLGLAEDSLKVLQTATKFYKTFSLTWLNYIDIAENKVVEARRVFKDASQRKGLDWPEAIWEKWLTFEYQFGSLDDIDRAIAATKEFKVKEEARRKKAWEDSYANAQVPSFLATNAANAVTQLPGPDTGSLSQVEDVDDNMQVTPSEPVSHDRPAKRKRSDEGAPEDSPVAKKTRVNEPPSSPPPPVFEAKQAEKEPDSVNNKSESPLKRDREGSTVLVSALPKEATEDDVRKLFKDCGGIREIQLKSLPNELVASVEFMDKDSIPAALTRDKKRIRGAEITVVVGWRSTLYVTNFREGMVDSEMRALFDEFGTILDVRWPSKRIKTTRRFCYVQYTTSEAAQAALRLHGHETEPDMKMTVLISDPTRKKERTDAAARELRVTGVVKSVTKAELENLFSPYGTLKDVRLIPAMNNNQTAFIEYEAEEEAQRALALNNHLLKNRRLAVTLADMKPNRMSQAPAARAETSGRSIRIRGLPHDTKEPLLQQALEKVTSVVRVHLLAASNEAIVELETMADAGRLLLEHPTLEFGGTTVPLGEERGPSGSVASRGRGRGRGTFGLSHTRHHHPQGGSTSGVGASNSTNANANANDPDTIMMPPPPVPVSASASASQPEAGDAMAVEPETETDTGGGAGGGGGRGGKGGRGGARGSTRGGRASASARGGRASGRARLGIGMSSRSKAASTQATQASDAASSTAAAPALATQAPPTAGGGSGGSGPASGSSKPRTQDDFRKLLGM
ncbi:Splicing factor [Serendipita sp. 407]|nr:Splicing factor [Serendipita sp. 407]